MAVKHKVVAGGAVLAVIATSLAGFSTVSAQGNADDVSLAEKIASKFNLDQGEVKAVFEENRSAREAERQAEISDRLQQAVDDGDITADQKKLIEQKQQQLEDARDAMKDELEKWAEDNDIDQKYLMFGGHGMRGGPGGPGGGGRF